jgi:hypothetical protein
MSKRIPAYLERYFWDVSPASLDVKSDSHFIIKRILDRGDTEDIRWLLSTYTGEEIRNVVTGTKDLARATGNFWADILGVDKKEVPCLQKPYFPIHFGLSS